MQKSRYVTIHKDLSVSQSWDHTIPIGINPSKVRVKMISYMQNVATGQILALMTPMVQSQDNILATISDINHNYDPGLTYDCKYQGVIHFRVMQLLDTIQPAAIPGNLGILAVTLEFIEE